MLRIARDVVSFAMKKKGWLLPALIAILIIGAVALLAEGAALSPLIYPVF